MENNKQTHAQHCVLRPQPKPYSRARALQPDQARALLAGIPRATRQGQRDYALLLTALISGRPLTEICQLRFGDLTIRGDTAWITWPGDQPPTPEQMPRPLWHAFRDFLAANGQMGSIRPEDYLFTPLSDRAAHLPNVDPGAWDATAPLSPAMVGRLIKKYARRAGLDPAHISAQTLRYTAAALRAQAGADPQQIADLLGYADPHTADRLLRQLQVNPPTPWQKLQAALGLDR